MLRLLWLLISAFSVMLVVVACRGESRVSEGERTPTPVTTGALPTGTAIPTVFPTLTPGPTDEAGTAVRVTTDKLRYRRGEPVIATIANNLSDTIYGVTSQTYCTIVAVQRREDGEWQTVGTCMIPRPPRFVPIEAGSQLAVEISPRLPDMGLDPGQYRIEFAFSVGSRGDPFQIVRSELFAVVE